MEPGSLLGDWHVRINDSQTYELPTFGPTDAHVRGSLGLDISEHIIRGQNHITFSVRTDRLDGGLRNPIYLAGDFGVQLNPPSLTNRAPTGRFEAYEANGLPFYAGVLQYETSFQLERIPQTEKVLVQLEHGVPFQEASEVAFNDGPWRPCLWSPYQVLVPAQEFVLGDNQLRLRVYTTLVRSFEGQEFDILEHRYREL